MKLNFQENKTNERNSQQIFYLKFEQENSLIKSKAFKKRIEMLFSENFTNREYVGLYKCVRLLYDCC